jgi:hypothetical protein
MARVPSLRCPVHTEDEHAPVPSRPLTYDPSANVISSVQVIRPKPQSPPAGRRAGHPLGRPPARCALDDQEERRMVERLITLINKEL